MDAPLNVLIQRAALAESYVKSAHIKEEYEAIVPPVAPKAAKPRPAPLGAPISAGRRIEPDMNKYVTDTSERKRSKIPG